VPLVRSLQDVSHPDEIPDPEDPKNLLKPQPRGIFNVSSLQSLDSELTDGRSLAFAAYRKKNGELGNAKQHRRRRTTRIRAMLDHVRSELRGSPTRFWRAMSLVTPYRLNDTSPCSTCDYRSVCRFETSVNRYHRLDSMGRVDVLKRVTEKNGKRE